MRLMGQPRAASNRLMVNGVEYAWAYRHAWFFDWETRVKGISVSVALNPGKTRELILDLSFDGFGPEKNPSLSKVAHAVQSAIPLAIEAGWEPDSRGKSFRYELSLGTPSKDRGQA